MDAAGGQHAVIHCGREHLEAIRGIYNHDIKDRSANGTSASTSELMSGS
jgi:hypothetical protein